MKFVLLFLFLQQWVALVISGYFAFMNELWNGTFFLAVAILTHVAFSQAVNSFDDHG